MSDMTIKSCALTFFLVSIFPPGVVHSVLESETFWSLSFLTNFSLKKDSEPRLSSGALVVTGFGLAGEVLKWTKVIGLKSLLSLGGLR